MSDWLALLKVKLQEQAIEPVSKVPKDSDFTETQKTFDTFGSSGLEALPENRLQERQKLENYLSAVIALERDPAFKTFSPATRAHHNAAIQRLTLALAHLTS
jgi:hypothetical protein